MPTITHQDDYFEDDGIIVTIPDGVRLTDGQRWTIHRVADGLDDEVSFALVEDQTCVIMPTDDARYGFDYFSKCVGERIGEYECCPPDFRMAYIGGGEYLLIVFGSLVRLVLPEDYPEMPAKFRGMGIPAADQVLQREKACEACEGYRMPIAMVSPKEPIYHEEFDEEKAAWVEDDESYEDDDPTGVERLTRILRGEAVVVTRYDEGAIKLELDDLREDLLADLEEMGRERDDEIAGLVAGNGANGSSLGESAKPLAAEIEEKLEHGKSIRKLAFDVLLQIEEGSAFENGEVADAIRRYYGTYVTMESGPKVVRQLFEDQGIDPEEGVGEFAFLVGELREAVESADGDTEAKRKLVQAELVYGLLKEFQEMEEAESRAREVSVM